jgi:KUP system potassium uptake protein
MLGADLLFGDGLITPQSASSRPSRGWASPPPTLTHLIIPITVLLLTGLFAVQFNGTAGIGPVMLVVGGAEAMYADLGHFGARPIRTGCFAVVYPACRSTCPPTTANGSSTSRPQTCCRPDGWACSAACASACSC